MKITIDIRTLSSRPSGIGLYVYHFIKEIIKYNDFELILITDIVESDEIKELKELGLKIIEFGKPIKKSLGVFSYFRFLKKILQENKPDIFWEPNQIIPINLRCKECKVVITMHDILPLTHTKYHKWYYVPYFYIFLRRTMKFVDGIIYNSYNTKSSVMNKFNVKATVNDHISYCIVNENRKSNIQDEKYFLYIGNLEKKKGVDILLDSYRLYLERGGEKRLLIAGNLREKDLQEKINIINRDCPKSVEYLGYITQEEKEDLLRKCSCFVFPSRAEGFGIPPIEAMYYRKPIIASDLEIFKEIMGNSVNYFELTNTMNDVENLANLMDSYEKNTSAYEEIIQKYSGEIRGYEIVNYFRSFKAER